MRTSLAVFLMVMGSIGFMATDSAIGHARTISITGTATTTWKLEDGAESNAETALVVDANKGDVLEIKSEASKHGFGTATQDGSEDDSLVQTCDDQAGKKNKPNAVFREIGCDKISNGRTTLYAKVLRPNEDVLRLEILDSFMIPTNFICVFHGPMMSGIVRPVGVPVDARRATKTRK